MTVPMVRMIMLIITSQLHYLMLRTQEVLSDADTAMDLPSTYDSATNGDVAMDSSPDVSSSSGDQCK